MDDSQSKAFTYISNRVSSTVASINCPNSKGKFVVEVIRSKVKIRPEIIDHESRISLIVDTESNIGTVSCNANLKNEETFRNLQETAKEHLEQSLKGGIRNAQKWVPIYSDLEKLFTASSRMNGIDGKRIGHKNSKLLKWIFSSIIV